MAKEKQLYKIVALVYTKLVQVKSAFKCIRINKIWDIIVIMGIRIV